MNGWIIIGILFGLLLALILYLLFTPLRLDINSKINLYRFSIRGLGFVELVPFDPLFTLRARVLFYQKEFDVFNMEHKSVKATKVERDDRETDKQRRKKKRSGKKRMKWLIKKLLRVPGTFRVKKLVLDLDSEDYIKNAYLFPVFESLNYWGSHRFHINYEGKFMLELSIENRLYRIAKVFIT